MPNHSLGSSQNDHLLTSSSSSSSSSSDPSHHSNQGERPIAEKLLPPITIATQNCGGIRGEYHKKHGPKISTIKALLQQQKTDFLILTETRVDQSVYRNVKLKWGLKATQCSLQQTARAGVIVYSREIHKIIPESTRVGTIAGHMCLAVYEIAGSRTIVGGIYGPSDNNDRQGVAFLRELSEKISELKTIYNTNHVLLAGDFNAVWRQEDSNCFHTRKPQTSRSFAQLMEDHSLMDLAYQSDKSGHTWFRNGREYQSSRIDYILTSIPTTGLEMMNTRVSNYLTTFDHTFLTATFGQKILKRTQGMKDYILGCEEFIIDSMEEIKQFLNENCERKPPEEDLEEDDNTEEERQSKTLDQEFQLHNRYTGYTALHLFNTIVQQLQQLHNRVAKKKAQKEGRVLQEASNKLFQLKHQLKTARTEHQKQEAAEEINNRQRELSNILESREHASHTRISNFYLLGNGTMAPQTFYCIKEKNINRDIQKLVVEDREITNQEEIVQVMQDWYEQTAMQETEQTIPLSQFLATHGIVLPTLDEEQREEMGEEFTTEEIKQALQEATESSAPGPSGQTINFFKLLFLEIPLLFTEALNQLVFVPGLASSPEFHWIKKRKVIYIPKKSSPQTPADYRPLSMLEVLYKIPSRILSKRIVRTLPTIIGSHQHGFMQKKGIQEPSILMTHLIQDANLYHKPLQLISFDIEKAFDRVSHKVIIQALRQFGFPEIFVIAIQEYVLTGTAYVEVNGRSGMLITIKTGSGQGDPPSSSLFLVASEPINLAIIAISRAISYQDRGGLRPNSTLFADDNINPTSLPTAAALQPILDLYQEYKEVSGLNINTRKSTALCINTSEEVKEGLRGMGIQTPTTIKHLGLHLAETIEGTVQETIRQIQPKTIKRRILATTPPTDLLHRARLINSAFVPIYNHVLMALPVTKEQLDNLDKEVRTFFWTRQKEGETLQKRRVVAKNRIPADMEVGGLRVPLVQTIAQGFKLNLLQRIYKRTEKPEHFPPSMLPTVLQSLLQQAGRPSLEEHIARLGPSQWVKTGRALLMKNIMFSQAFSAGSQMLKLLEMDPESWHHSPIVGHSQESIFQITTPESWELDRNNIIVIGQLLLENENGTITNQMNEEILDNITINLRIKLRRLLRAVLNQRPPIQDKRQMPVSSMMFLMNRETNMSVIYKKFTQEKLTKEIDTAPAYDTRVRDGVYVPDRRTFQDAFRVTTMAILPCKTKETAFQILNRTIWTNNKAFKSGRRDNPNCDWCEETETMEHLLYGCDNHTSLLWREISTLMTRLITRLAGQQVARIDYTPKEIVYNVPHPSIQLHLQDGEIKKTLILFIQEIKRDIMYRRMNIMEGHRNRQMPLVRIQAHIMSVVKKIISILNYQGTMKVQKSREIMEQMLEILEEMIV